jgi:FtsP/CotA-like multicopper oxidase with cupredoxin domain
MPAVLRRYGPNLAAAAGVALLVALLAFVGKAWWDSRLPSTYSVMSYGEHDYGGGSVPPDHAGHGGARSVVDFHGRRVDVPDAHFTLVARSGRIRLSSGRTMQALTFNGSSPGPEIRVHQGDNVAVTLENADVEQGVTIHWHGVDVPNAEDGVAGITQDAVLPGERYTYRFHAGQVGTFWYHSHQVSSSEVRRGLFGAFVIEPRKPGPRGLDVTLVAHTFNGIPALNANDGLEQRAVPRGAQLRIRLVNSDSSQQRFSVSGARFKVLAIDGVDLNGPTPLENQELQVAAGGRADVGFTMPASPVLVSIKDRGVGLALSTDGTSAPMEKPATRTFDPAAYGRPAQTPFDATADYDRHFDLTITRKLAFFDGRPGRQWAINGHVYPDVPMFVVRRGDLVSVTITNRTKVVHPMHLHGHHLLVVSRNGEPTRGSPWWVDTLDVRPGERYVTAFRANNPGIWMDHCHNLGHAAAGLTMHVAYAGVTTPFLVGASHHNTPE